MCRSFALSKSRRRNADAPTCNNSARATCASLPSAASCQSRRRRRPPSLHRAPSCSCTESPAAVREPAVRALPLRLQSSRVSRATFRLNTSFISMSRRSDLRVMVLALRSSSVLGKGAGAGRCTEPWQCARRGSDWHVRRYTRTHTDNKRTGIRFLSRNLDSEVEKSGFRRLWLRSAACVGGLRGAGLSERPEPTSGFLSSEFFRFSSLVLIFPWK